MADKHIRETLVSVCNKAIGRYLRSAGAESLMGPDARAAVFSDAPGIIQIRAAIPGTDEISFFIVRVSQKT